MNEIILRYRNDKTRGLLKFQAKNNSNYYGKFGYAPTLLHYGCGHEICDKDFRYINYMDENNIVSSKSFYCLAALAHKRPYNYYTWPRGFDHTTQWRRKGDKFPLFVLTEPYGLPYEEDFSEWDEICERFNLVYKIYEPSEKSLWVPNQTYMIFFWSPTYWNFEDRLMEHTPWSELINKRKLEI